MGSDTVRRMEAATDRSPRLAGVVTAAGQLESEGRFLEAARLLETVRQRDRDPGIDVRVVQLRHQAFAEVRSGSPAAPPNDVPDLFPGVVGPPEIASSEVTVEHLRSAVRHHGCLLVRGILAESHVVQLRADIDNAFTAFDAHRAGTPLSETSPWYMPLRPEYGADDLDPVAEYFLRTAGGVYAGSSPRSFIDYLEILTELGMIDLARSYLGEPPVMSLNKSVLRRIGGGAQPTWHQDGSYLGEDIQALNLWMALSSCGGETEVMGLDLVPRPMDGLAPMGTHDAVHPRSIAQAVVDELAQDAPVVRPVFEPGDGLLFDQVFVHRSDVRPLPTERYAIESWFFAPSTYPSNLVPIVAM